MTIQDAQTQQPIWRVRRDPIDGGNLEICCNERRVLFIALDEQDTMSVAEAYALGERVASALQSHGMPDPKGVADVEICRSNVARPAHFSIAPVRIQYQRGTRMRSPNGLMCAYVGRPTPFGNPFKVGAANTLTRKDAVDAFRAHLLARPFLVAQVRGKLRGKNLACWCALDGQPCHADVLLEVANKHS